jgi:predicted amidohydrolase
MLEEKISMLDAPTDIIVLPEMFTTGFTMNTSLAEPMNLDTYKWMQLMSKKAEACVVGSYIVKEGSAVYNRLVWMFPDGTSKHYDKRHLFRMGGEHLNYQAGNHTLIIEYKGWKIAPFICYDLRFPVWTRNVQLSYDVLLFVANWPAARAYAWKQLLIARAIENISYLVGVNRVGEDGNQLTYSGNSCILDFKGFPLIEMDDDVSDVFQIELSKQPLENYRNSFSAHLDADSFIIN